MCQLCVRLLVALLTFAVGLLASVLWGLTGAVEVSAPAAPAPSAAAPRVLLREAAPAPAARPVHAGILNRKAVSKPAPEYPAVARAARARGEVVVIVNVDEEGRVSSAEAVSGHPLLRQAAAEAARAARFAPTLLSGRPVRVSGVLTYSFVPE